MRKPPLLLMGLCLAATGCGSQEEAEAPLGLAIKSPFEFPFHGPNGPGTEPIYIGFSWTVVVSAGGGPESRIGMVVTKLTERTSGAVLTTEDGPLGTLSSGGSLEAKQETFGFFSSSLYPGDWTAITTVEVSYASGRSETLTASFAFR